MPFRFFQHQRHEHVLGLLPLLLGGEIQRRIARVGHSEGQQGGQQRHDFVQWQTVAVQPAFHFDELGVVRVLALPSQ